MRFNEKVTIKEGMLLLVGKNKEKFLVTRNRFDVLIAVNSRGTGWFEVDSVHVRGCVNVVAIYDRPFLYAKTCLFETKDRTLLWKKEEEKKEMTIAEIEKVLGYEVKIVKGENDYAF